MIAGLYKIKDQRLEPSEGVEDEPFVDPLTCTQVFYMPDAIIFELTLLV